MRHALFTTALATASLFVVACSDERSPLPTQPPPVANLTPPAGCPTDLEVLGLIGSLFTPKDFLASARIYYLTSIKGKISRGDITGARQVALVFIDFILKSYDADKLIGGKSAATQEKVVRLINAVLCWVGLPPLPPGTLAGGPVTIRVIGSGGGDLRANDGLAGVRVPAGAVSGDHVFIASRRDDLARAGTCLINSPYTQYPLCYDFSVAPVTAFNVNVTVAVCQLEPPPAEPVLSQLRLAHPGPEGGIDILVKASAPSFTPPLDCTNAILLGSRSREDSGWFATGWTALKRLGSLAVNLITPKPLYAGHVALGGLTISFSPFIAVDVGPPGPN